jgi:hypothetical protein
MSVKYTQKPLHIPTSSIASPSKIYPNYDFWLENMPSGNPGMASNVRFQFFRFLDDSSEDKSLKDNLLKGQFIKAAEFSCRHFFAFFTGVKCRHCSFGRFVVSTKCLPVSGPSSWT